MLSSEACAISQPLIFTLQACHAANPELQHWRTTQLWADYRQDRRRSVSLQGLLVCDEPVCSGIAWTQTDDVQSIGRILHSTWSPFTRCDTLFVCCLFFYRFYTQACMQRGDQVHVQQEQLLGSAALRRTEAPNLTRLSKKAACPNKQWWVPEVILKRAYSARHVFEPAVDKMLQQHSHHARESTKEVARLLSKRPPPDMTDYVAYVAKDPVNRRACHILECCEGLAQDVICTIGQAFELRFKQYLQCPSKLPTLQDRMLNLEEPAWTEEEEEETAEHPYYNSIPGKIPPLGGFNDVRMKNQAACPTDGAQPTTMTGRDQTYYQGRHLVENQSDDRKPAPVRQGSSDVICQPEGKTQLPKMGEVATYVNTQHIDVQALVALQANSDTVISGTAGIAKDSPRKDIFDMKPFEDAIRNRSPVLNKTASIDNSSPLLARAAAFNMKEELKSEPWYHGEMSRKEAEQLLKGDGDFLVRKSTTNPGSYVLTGMHNGHSKHLLLVDPEGANPGTLYVWTDVQYGHDCISTVLCSTLKRERASCFIRNQPENKVKAYSSGSQTYLTLPSHIIVIQMDFSNPTLSILWFSRSVFAKLLTIFSTFIFLKVRTKDHIFESISHLISHHRDNNLPIVSAGSELCLKQPVKRRQ
ncbi:SHC3 protein, partial [Polyodon spathula]|nr:SHC3 protein [Polyodon spathula]